MNASTVIAILVLLAILSAAILYIVREKKRGVKCVGCPFAGSCQKHSHAGMHNVQRFSR